MQFVLKKRHFVLSMNAFRFFVLCSKLIKTKGVTVWSGRRSGAARCRKTGSARCGREANFPAWRCSRCAGFASGRIFGRTRRNITTSASAAIQSNTKIGRKTYEKEIVKRILDSVHAVDPAAHGGAGIFEPDHDHRRHKCGHTDHRGKLHLWYLRRHNICRDSGERRHSAGKRLDMGDSVPYSGCERRDVYPDAEGHQYSIYRYRKLHPILWYGAEPCAGGR
ncbi:hypothetical protein SDC9_155621 [bioreactor metagenome]|uniref:Uncharacterized protein n=1 Tax=bioreactor metagenome TaxID=1076179 RepID=A0A645F4I2_9ZZZZ